MRTLALTALLLTACGQSSETDAARAPVTVTPTHYEFLGNRYLDLKQLGVAIEDNAALKLSLTIDEERGCVAAERVSQVVALLQARDESSVAFIGRSSTDACQR